MFTVKIYQTFHNFLTITEKGGGREGDRGGGKQDAEHGAEEEAEEAQGRERRKQVIERAERVERLNAEN